MMSHWFTIDESSIFFLSFQSQVKQSAAYQSGFPGLLTPHLGIIVSLLYANYTNSTSNIQNPILCLDSSLYPRSQMAIAWSVVIKSLHTGVYNNLETIFFAYGFQNRWHYIWKHFCWNWNISLEIGEKSRISTQVMTSNKIDLKMLRTILPKFFHTMYLYQNFDKNWAKASMISLLLVGGRDSDAKISLIDSSILMIMRGLDHVIELTFLAVRLQCPWG